MVVVAIGSHLKTMPATEQLASTLRKSGVVRKLESELQVLHTDHRKTAKQRWSTCFAFIFRRSKFKSTDQHYMPSSFYPCSTTSSCTSYSSSSSTSTAVISTPNGTNNRDNETNNDNVSTGKSVSVEKPTYHPKTSFSPASSLSPPPRKHIMTRQCRTKSLTPLDYTFTAASIIPVNPPLQRRHYIPRPSVLRLSLDVDQRYSYTSSIYSSDSHGAELVDGSDNDNQSLLQETSTTLIERRRQRQQQQRCFSWMEEKTTPWKHDGDEEDEIYSTWHSQISKDKAHYDAIVASTMHHRHSTKEKVDPIATLLV